MAFGGMGGGGGAIGSNVFGVLTVKDNTAKAVRGAKQSLGSLGKTAAKTSAELGALGNAGVTRTKTALSGLSAAAAKSKTRFEELGGSADGLGGKLELAAAAMTAIGAAAAHASNATQRELTKIQALVGLTAGEVGNIESQLDRLAATTGQAPQELARAAFDITSAGLRGADALEALEAASVAASAGMGETQSVADALTSAMNAYGHANLNATAATDVLIASVREGKFEASELAPVIGRLLPISAELGVSFGELAGGIAFLTRSTGKADVAATQMLGVLNKLLKPSKNGEEILAKLGMTVQDLQRQVDDDFLGALRNLRTGLDDAGISAAHFFEDVRAVAGGLQLTGAQADSAAQIIGKVVDSAGSTDLAGAITANTDFHAAAQSSAVLRAAFEDIGQAVSSVLAPAMLTLATAVKSVTGAFAGIPAGFQQLAVVGAALVPVALGAGTAIRGVTFALAGLRAMAPLAAAAFGPVGIAIAAVSLLAGVGLVAAMARSSDATDHAAAMTERQDRVNQALGLTVDEVTTKIEAMTAAVTGATRASVENAAAAQVQADHLDTQAWTAVAAQVAGGSAALVAFRSATDEADVLLGRVSGSIAGTEQRFAGLRNQTELNVSEFRAAARAAGLTTVEINALEEAAVLAGRAEAVMASKANDTARDHLLLTGTISDLEGVLGKDYVGAVIAAAKESDDWTGTLDTLTAAVQTAELAAMGLSSASLGVVEPVGAAADAAAAAERKLSGLTDELLANIVAWNQLGAAAAAGANVLAQIETGGVVDFIPGVDYDIESLLNRQQIQAAVGTADAARSAGKSGLDAAGQEQRTFVHGLMRLAESAAADQFAQALLGTPQQIQSAFDGLVRAGIGSDAFEHGPLAEAFDAARQRVARLIELSTEIEDARQSLHNSHNGGASLYELLGEALGSADSIRAEAISAKAITPILSELDSLVETARTATAKMDQLRDELGNLKAARETMVSSVAGQLKPDIADTLTVGGAVDVVRQMSDFRDRIVMLARKGFPGDLLGEVVGLGMTEGSAAAKQLLSMSNADLGQVIALNQQIRGIAGSIGENVAGASFDAKIDAKTGEVDAAKVVSDAAWQAAAAEADRLAGLAQANVEAYEALITRNEAAMGTLVAAIQSDFVAAVTSFLTALELPAALRAELDAWLPTLAATMATGAALFHSAVNATVADATAKIGAAASSAVASVQAASSAAAAAAERRATDYSAGDAGSLLTLVRGPASELSDAVTGGPAADPASRFGHGIPTASKDLAPSSGTRVSGPAAGTPLQRKSEVTIHASIDASGLSADEIVEALVDRAETVGDAPDAMLTPQGAFY